MVLINKYKNICSESIKNDTFSNRISRGEYQKIIQIYLNENIKNKKINTDEIVGLLLLSLEFKEYLIIKKIINQYNLNINKPSKITEYLARLYSENSTHKKAIDLFKELKLINKLESIISLYLYFNSLFELAMFKECEEILEIGLKKYPENLYWKIFTVRYQIKTKHLFSHHEENIDDNLSYLKKRTTNSEDLYLLADCYFQYNKIKETIELLQESIVNIKESKRNPENSSSFDTISAFETIKEITLQIETIGAESFLAFGTLLGIIRDGKLMDHDKDADIGIIYTEFKEIVKIISKICEVPHLICPAIIKEPKDHSSWMTSIIDLKRGTSLDIFFFHEENSNYYAGIKTHSGLLKWKFNKFKIIKYEVQNYLFNIPDNTEFHLTELYTDWRKKITVWDSLLNCSNLTEDSKDVVTYYGLIRLYKAIQNMNDEKIFNYYNTLKTKWKFNFNNEVEAKIEELRKINIENMII